MLLTFIIYIAVCIGGDVYAFCGLRKCNKEVDYTIKQKISHRVIVKVCLDKKIVAIQSFLSFGFVVSLIVAFMGFFLAEHFPSKLWVCSIPPILILVSVLFALLCAASIYVSQKIDKL